MQMDRRLQSPTDARIDLELGFYRCNTAFIAALDVKTAFDVAKPSVVHGHLTAALSAEMRDVGRVCVLRKRARRNSDTQGAFAKVVWKLRCCGAAWPSTCCGKQKKIGRQRAGRSPFGGQHGSEYVLRGMSWADNYWLFCDNRERLTCMVNDIIEELLDLDMEPTGIAVLDWHSET